MSTYFTRSYGATEQRSEVVPLQIERRDLGLQDVKIRVLFCGICHSDAHAIDNDWGDTQYPIVPGHEIVGIITELGGQVFPHFNIGDTVAVGCMVDSCGQCPDCQEGVEQYCKEGTYTYNSHDPHLNQMTFGGFSESIVVDQKFVFKVPNGLDPAAVAPLLCAGITPYSALRHFKVGEGTKVAVVGLGGIGHMAVKLARAMGAEVTVITSTPDKLEDAVRLGANKAVLSTNPEQMDELGDRFDLILNTTAVHQKLDPFISMLRRDGTLCLIGVPPIQDVSINTSALTFGRKKIAGSMIGGVKETEEMLDFCAEHNIVADIERIGASVEQINQALDKVRDGKVKYRVVIDMLQKA